MRSARCWRFLAINGQWISATEDDHFEMVVGSPPASCPISTTLASRYAPGVTRKAEPLDPDRCARVASCAIAIAMVIRTS